MASQILGEQEVMKASPGVDMHSQRQHMLDILSTQHDIALAEANYTMVSVSMVCCMHEDGSKALETGEFEVRYPIDDMAVHWGTCKGLKVTEKEEVQWGEQVL